MPARTAFRSELDRLAPRPRKPRSVGLTSLIDYGPGLHGWTGPASLRDFLGACSDFFDFAKIFGLNAILLPEDLIRGIADAYKDHGILTYSGGILFEFAHLRGLASQLPDLLRGLGIPGMEISENYVTLDERERIRYITSCRDQGLSVIYEYGRKNPDRPLSLRDLRSVLTDVFSAGATHAVIEQSEIDLLVRDDAAILDELRDQAWMNRVLIEIDPFGFPAAHVQMIDRFGSGVNLANITPAHVLALEGYRRGLGRPVDYALLRAAATEPPEGLGAGSS